MSECCAREGCANSALYLPVLLLRPKGYTGAPIESAIDLSVCATHAIEMRVEHVMGDEGFARLCEAIRSRGLAEPDRASTQLAFVPLSHSPFRKEKPT